MKVIISQQSLLDRLKIVSRAVSGQNTLPVLGNILIRAEGKKVYFLATNLEISISTSTEATVKNEGAITVPAKILTSYTSLLKSGEDVEFNVSDGTTLEVKSNSSNTKIKGIAADEFPKITEVKSGTSLEIENDIFREMVQEVAFASLENASRPILSGVYFAGKKEELRVAATDSYRLSEKIIKLKKAVDKFSCVIPVRTIFEADRLAGMGKGLKITIAENQVMFTADGTELISRLIDGQFPDYKQILPATHSSVVFVDREAFALGVRRVSIFAKENNQHMKLDFQGDGNLVISTDSTQIGEEQTRVPIKLEGGPNMIALNTEYVLDALNALASESKVRVELDGKMTPAVIKKEKVDNFVHLVMPLKM